MNRFRRLIRDLTGRSDEEFARLLIVQIDATIRGAELARDLVTGQLDAAECRELIKAVEHEGDEGRSQLVAELTRALTTPIDREDLFRLSRSVDDVLDNIRDFVRATDLFGITGPEHLLPLIDAIIEGVRLMRPAVLAMTESPLASTQAALAAKKTGNQVRRYYDEEVALLLVGDLTTEMLRRRELLRRLDVVGLRLGEAADALADGAMKRGA